jgi:hypothetical protein
VATTFLGERIESGMIRDPPLLGALTIQRLAARRLAVAFTCTTCDAGPTRRSRVSADGAGGLAPIDASHGADALCASAV